MKHTKGPWTVFDLGYGLGICPKECEEELIPNVAAVNSAIVRFKVPEASGEDWDQTFAKQKADANLMAAAPEMYEMLLKFEEKTRGTISTRELNEQINALIKKARGE